MVTKGSDYTKGKLEYIGSVSIVATEPKGSRRLSIATVLTEAVDIDTSCKYPVDFQANARRLLRVWNGFDGLLDACKNLVKHPECVSCRIRAEIAIAESEKG